MPTKVSTNRKWLERHGQTWRVTVAVPRNLQKVLGTRLKRSLKTDSLAVANRLKMRVVDELHTRIAEAGETAAGTPRSFIREALEIAEYLKTVKGENEIKEIDNTIRLWVEDILGPVTAIRVDPETGEQRIMHHPKREALAKDFIDVTSGRATPMTLHHDDYLSKSNVKPRTRADDVRALRYLLQWCEREKVPASFEAMNRKNAVRFMDALGGLCGGLAARTQNKYLGRLSRYWGYLLLREHVESNPWAGLLLEVPATKHDEEERAFTDEEVRLLLQGDAEPRLRDLMLIAALTGARLDAIVDMRVRDVVDGAFTFKPQKKEKGSRDVPIHPALREIVERRTAGKGPKEPFFPDWPAPAKVGSLRERSFKASNRFTDYRRACGVDEVVEGKRRALVNFHSFRRWFITKAERKGYSGDLIAAIVGHKRVGMTFGRYSEGPEWQQACQCVAAISLPPLDGSLIKEGRSLSPRRRPVQQTGQAVR